MTSPVIEQRADIEAETAGLTLCGLLRATAEAHGDSPAYSDREGDGAWQTLTWQQFRDQVLQLWPPDWSGSGSSRETGSR